MVLIVCEVDCAGAQLVCCHLSPAESSTARTAGGQTVTLDTAGQQLTVNSLPVRNVIRVEFCTLFILDSLLFVRQKEFERAHFSHEL